MRFSTCKHAIFSILFAAAMLYFPPAASAQATAKVDAFPIPPDRGAAGAWQALHKLQTRASVLVIVAHPDDEDGGMIAYESRGLGARVSLMTLDRGEGGANVMSADYWDALGLVRTEELLQAGRYYGLDKQYFATTVDYGFSKSLDEALAQWGHDRVLEQVVRVVRTVRPIIIASSFVGGPTDGHGQHAVSGLTAQEAFDAAADPTKFPEQIKEGLQPWRAAKVYARTPFFRISEKGMYDYATHTWGPVGVTNHVTGKWEPGKPSTTVNIPVGTYDPIVGQTYVEISRTGLGFQKSQNGGPNVPLPAMQDSAYHRFGSHVPAQDKEESFFDGINTSLASIADLAPDAPALLQKQLVDLQGYVQEAVSQFSAMKSDDVAVHLAEGKLLVEQMISSVQASAMKSEGKQNVLEELKVKDRQFNDALVAVLQVTLEAEVTHENAGNDPMSAMRGASETFQMATRGMTFPVKVHLYQPSSEGVAIEDVELADPTGRQWNVSTVSAPSTLTAAKAVDLMYKVTVPLDEPYTQPFFTRSSLEDAYYDVSGNTPDNIPLPPYPLQANATFRFHGAAFTTARTVQVIDRVNGPGTVRYPMPVGPKLSIALTPPAGIVPLGMQHTEVTVRVRSNMLSAADPTLSLDLPKGWNATPKVTTLHFKQAGEEQTVSFDLTPQVENNVRYTMTAVATLNGEQFKQGYTQIGYQGLRPYFLYAKAQYVTTGTDVKVAPGLNVAYIEGSGDDVPAALEQLGVHVTYLSAQDLAGANLSKYSTILLGVRAYAVRPDLVANNARLLEYVHNGGTMIVQYNTPEFDHNFGPYPYVMTNDPEEVTDEKSVVSILEPTSPVFTWPNKITSADFDGWIEERGSKFLDTWDPKYTPLLETHDKGQKPQEGGLLYARYGKGIYVYNAYAFYRQLPSGVPGAFRLFANLLSLPKNPDVH
jgi:LmbE family N-acetylglucosaminyl deacetylase